MSQQSQLTSESFVLPLALWRRALERPDEVFYEEVDGPRLTYRQFHERALRWATIFNELGVTADELVPVMVPTGIGAFEIWLGLAWLRAVAVPLNTDYRGALLTHALNTVAARLAVIHSRYIDRIGPIADQIKVASQIIVADQTAMPNRSLAPDSLPAPRIHDLQAIIFTSGTTGPSKAVLVPWGHMEGQNPAVFPGEQPGTRREGAYYSFYPSYHASGMGAVGLAVYMNIRLVVKPVFSASGFWEDVRRYQVTHTILIGPVGSWLLSQPATSHDANNTLRRVGMYPLIPRYKEFERRFGVEVVTGFGMTEAGMPFATAEPVNYQSVGHKREGYQARIADENDYPLPAGTVGELLLRHEEPWRMNVGYLDRPGETARAWRNGWFHTGDGFRCDDDGNYYFVDRLKDCLRRRGENISSMEVEAEVSTHPSVAECACIGVPADDAEDEVMVIVVLAQRDTVTAESLVSYLADRMPRFMVPRYVKFVDSLPKSANGKVKKVELRAAGVTQSTWDRVAAGFELQR